MADFLNHDSFPFTIVNGDIIYGPIYNLQANNKIRFWKIEINLFDEDDVEMNITKSLINKLDNDDNYYTVIHKITGYMDKNSAVRDVISDTVTEGKNLGKRNETNILQQSLIMGRNYYLKKINAGFKTNLENVKNQTDETNNDLIPFPMAVNEYSKHIKKITYPCYIQPKLDGIRALIFKDKNTNKLTMLSRRHKQIYGFENILNELQNNNIFNISNSIYLDGELYLHNVPLQEISGIVRKENHSDKQNLDFCLFDIFDTNNPSLNFKERMNLINNNLNGLNKTKLLETILCNSAEEVDELYENYLNDGYEGVIYKPINKPYEFSFNKEKRSSWYLKRKPAHDSEFKVIGYELDKNECIIFIMETKKGKTFKSVPMWTQDQKKSFIYENDFHKDYKNTYATIRYDDLSKDGVPIRSRFVCFRNYE